MLIYEFYDEFDNLNERRQVQGLKALFSEIEGDPEQYEDIIFDLEELSHEAGIGEDNAEPLENVRRLFEFLCDDLGNSTIFDLLEIASELESDDYFGTEGLDI